jgi:hypothetical protein
VLARRADGAGHARPWPSGIVATRPKSHAKAHGSSEVRSQSLEAATRSCRIGKPCPAATRLQPESCASRFHFRRPAAARRRPRHRVREAELERAASPGVRGVRARAVPRRRAAAVQLPALRAAAPEPSPEVSRAVPRESPPEALRAPASVVRPEVRAAQAVLLAGMAQAAQRAWAAQAALLVRSPIHPRLSHRRTRPAKVSGFVSRGSTCRADFRSIAPRFDRS